MPKLDGTHLPQRLAERLADLKSGKEVAARDIKNLLNDEQVATMDAAWKEQQELRNGKRARTKEEEREFGWKTKREIHIEAYERAVAAADGGVLDELGRLQLEAKKRQMRIYMDTKKAALEQGKDILVAENLANNELTRAGLSRMDGQVVGHQNSRDKEVWALEAALKHQVIEEMDECEREQFELLQEHEKAVREKGKKLGKGSKAL